MTQNSRTNRSIFIFAFAIFGSIFSLIATPALEWDPNVDDVAGYKVYSGEKSREYDHVVDVGTQTSLALTNLDPGITYYFAVTAYDANFLESDFSDEISYTSLIDGVTAAAQPCMLNVTNGTVKISFLGKSGHQCWLEASSDFKTWERVKSGTMGSDSMIECPDLDGTSRPMRFYRVVLSPP